MLTNEEQYLPLLLKNMATGKDFNYSQDFKYGYEDNDKTRTKKRAAVFTPPFIVRRMNHRLEFKDSQRFYDGTVKFILRSESNAQSKTA